MVVHRAAVLPEMVVHRAAVLIEIVRRGGAHKGRRCYSGDGASFLAV